MLRQKQLLAFCCICVLGLWALFSANRSNGSSDSSDSSDIKGSSARSLVSQRGRKSAAAAAAAVVPSREDGSVGGGGGGGGHVDGVGGGGGSHVGGVGGGGGGGGGGSDGDAPLLPSPRIIKRHKKIRDNTHPPATPLLQATRHSPRARLPATPPPPPTPPPLSTPPIALPDLTSIVATTAAPAPSRRGEMKGGPGAAVGLSVVFAGLCRNAVKHDHGERLPHLLWQLAKASCEWERRVKDVHQLIDHVVLARCVQSLAVSLWLCRCACLPACLPARLACHTICLRCIPPPTSMLLLLLLLAAVSAAVVCCCSC